jgi:hypothetical protein
MTTNRIIVSDALRESGILGLGDTMEAAQYEEGLRRLQALVDFLTGFELGEGLLDWSYGTSGIDQTRVYSQDYTSIIDSGYVPSNTRLVCNLSAAKTIYLDP